MQLTNNVKITKGTTSSKTKILDQKDISIIKEHIGIIFGEDTVGHLNLNLNLLKIELLSIINKIKLIQVYHSNSSKIKGQRVSRMGKQKRMLLAEAYLIIFKVRQFLLNENINYRYYFNVQDSAKVIQFDEDNILKYMKFGTFAIQILDSALKKEDTNSEYQSLIDQHYINLMNGVQQANTTGFYVVHSYIMNRYNTQNPGLRKKNNQYQVFTRGHLFEAMDIAFSESIKNNTIQNFSAIEAAMYGKYLSYDSIAGVKGGDNAITMTQIKANAADIMDYSTILNNLNKILVLLEMRDKQSIITQIKELYLSRDKFETDFAFEEAAEKAAEKLLDILIKT